MVPARHHRSSVTLTLVVLLGSLGLGMFTRPVAAATLTITSLSCETLVSGFRCDGWVSGGTGSYTYTWTPTGTISNYADHSSVLIKCPPGVWVRVTFTVRDSSGATAAKTISQYCSGGTP